MLSNNLVLKLHIWGNGTQKCIMRGSCWVFWDLRSPNWKDGYGRREWPTPVESQESSQAGCMANMRKGVSRRKPMASLQNSVNCSHTQVWFQVFPRAWNNSETTVFRAERLQECKWCFPKTRSLCIYTTNWNSFQSLLGKNKRKENSKS